jgi:hypothetical protein
VNAAINNRRATPSGDSFHLVSTQGVARVNAYANDIARLNTLGVEFFQGLIHECQENYRWD